MSSRFSPARPPDLSARRERHFPHIADPLDTDGAEDGFTMLQAIAAKAHPRRATSAPLNAVAVDETGGSRYLDFSFRRWTGGNLLTYRFEVCIQQVEKWGPVHIGCRGRAGGCLFAGAVPFTSTKPSR